MKKVLIPLATGFEEIEALTLADILKRADITVIMASLDSNTIVTGAHNIKVVADTSLTDILADEFDMIVLPGGMPGSEHLAHNNIVQTIIKKFDNNNKLIGAICAAPWALSTAGVLKSEYTCYPSFEKVVAHKGYNPNKKVVCDENIITSQGPATAMEFALEIIRKLTSEEKYREIKAGLLL